MKNSVFTLSVLLLLSCSKEANVSKKLSGDWNLTSYRRTDSEGLITYPEASGTAEFISYDKGQDSSNYHFDISCALPDVDTNLYTGTYKLVEKGDFMYLAELDSLNQVNSYIKYRILTLTKTDLEIEFSQNSNTDILLFRRN